MHIEVVDRDLLEAHRQPFQGSRCNRIQITKSHGAISSRMVAWRPEQTKGRLARTGGLQSLQSLADGLAGEAIDLREEGSVAPKIQWWGKSLAVGFGMRAE